MPRFMDFYPPRRMMRMIEILQSHGCSCSEALRAAGLTTGMMSLQFVPTSSLVVLFEQLVITTGRSDIGFLSAMHTPIGAEDVVVQLLLSAPDLRKSFDAFGQYPALVSPVVTLRAQDLEDGSCDLQLTVLPTLPYHAAVTVLEAIAVTLHRHYQLALQDTALKCNFRYSWEAAAHAGKYREALNSTVQYGLPDANGQPRAILNYAAPVLRRGFATSDPDVFKSVLNKARLTTAQMQAELSYSQWLEGVLSTMDEDILTQKSAARILNMSPKTLSRHLENEGTTFGSLVKKSLIKRAKHLLGDSTLSIHEISATLGFSSTANFARSFKSSSGVTPSEFRKKAQAADEAAVLEALPSNL